MIAHKKNLLAFIFLCLFSIVTGTTYYVSSTGNDAANGLSESTSWKSLTKVNSAFSTFKPGDMILFKRGDTFYGSLNVTVAGASGNPLIISAYGTGASPVISGFTVLSDWTSAGNGIYSKAVSWESNPNIVTVDGVNTPLGRSPILPSTVGWPSNIPTGDSYSSTSLYDAALSSSPDLDGAEVVIRTTQWTVERKTISHSGQSMTYSGTRYTPPAGAGYFIQNHISTLNVLGEWYFANGTIYMYFGADNPTNHVVKVSSRNNVLNISSRNYITIDGITIEGANQSNINIYNSDYVLVKNCFIRFGGNYGIYGDACDYFTIESNTINSINNDGIYLNSNSTHATIRYNAISYIGMLLGMGDNGDEGYNSVVAEGDYTLITYNTIEYSGYDGIRWGGQGSQITYNYITNSCQNKADGAGIYSYRDYNTSKLVDHNIVFYSAAQPYGWEYQDWTSANGIYQDGAENTLITNNVVAHIQGKGIFVNSHQNSTVEYNTLFNNSEGIFIMSEPEGFNNADGRARDHTIRYNILFAKTKDQSCLSLVTKNDASDLSLFGIIDYNYFARPISNDNYIFSEYSAWGGPYVEQNLTEWKSAYGYDKNSTASPIILNDVNKIRFEYNETKVNKSVSLDAGYVDIKGAKYSGNITLLPYTSIILMVDPNPSAPPASPVYVSSAIENAAPAILEMTYNTTLANILPAASSFSVRVNSVARTVNSVAISGAKVRLSLASPVASGEVVTIAYTKPASNPIQTAAGGQAANLSAQTVTNRVSSVPVNPVNPVNPVYVGSTVENDTPSKIGLVFNMSLSNVLPVVSAFTVRVNSVTRNVTSVAISGSSVILTLASDVIFGDVVTVTYTKPATNALQSTTGLQLASLSTQTVTNKVSSVGPIYVSSSIEKSTPNILELNYNEILGNSIPPANAFIVMVNGISRSITSIAISGKKVLLTLASPVVYGDIITVSYTIPANNPLKKSTGETAGSFSSPQRVTNNTIKKGNIYVYPNPAREFINISIKEPNPEKQIIRIFDFSGRLCLETILDPFANTIRIPISLNSGVYIVQVILGSITSFTQKIIVTN